MNRVKEFVSKPREIVKLIFYTLIATFIVVYPMAALDLLLIVGISAWVTFVLFYFGYCLANNKWLTFKELWRKMK